MCDVPSIRVAVFCSESIECFPGRASKFFLKLLLLLIVVVVVVVVEGNRKLDRDHEHSKPKSEEDEEKKRSTAKNIRGGAKERNVRGRKALRAASYCVEGPDI